MARPTFHWVYITRLSDNDDDVADVIITSYLMILPPSRNSPPAACSCMALECIPRKGSSGQFTRASSNRTS
ncbi:hypothetical protein ARMSODRAFT_966001 [Armillaria solidipes]|uniref:Uncharacterized protein n=1 Tax=Armillaria solidipes TaxID=1076256 RepID=A0A2H3AP20_9AGAR|nr:hypothetical protein ARMSODRAFT_966001 [Armillaria solidipes]